MIALAKHTDATGTLCPVARSTDLVGDRGTLLVLRELFMGVSRFRDLQAQTGLTAQLLAARLKQLEADGLLRKRPYSNHPLRHDYTLTPKSAELLPVLLALRSWGERWCKSPEEDLALRTIHRGCGAEVDLDGVCPICSRRVAWPELDASPTPNYVEERRKRAVTFRVARPVGNG